MKYLDISEHQGLINFAQVKPHVDGIIIRAGHGKNHIDKYFQRNVTECNRLKIPCGAYWFSYAYTPEMAKKEAQYLLQVVKQYKVELPLVFDFEYDSIEYAKGKGIIISKELASEIARAFCSEIEQNRYYVLNYTNLDFINRYYNDYVNTHYGLWLAYWTTAKQEPPIKCQIWQWTNKGYISGINTNVDLNEVYLDLKTIIKKANLNHLQDQKTVQCPYTRPLINLRIGSSGDNVRWLQWCLNYHGASLKIDGKFGFLTWIALCKYQMLNSLKIDGICGKETISSLEKI